MTNVMLHGHEFYVATRERAQDLERVAAIVGDNRVHSEVGNPYCVVLWAKEDFVPPDDVLEALSRELSTETLWLAWQKQVDGFAFQRWVSGTPIRRLAYGVERERIWETVEGTPESWEADAFFSPARLTQQLRVRSLFPNPSGMSDSELQRVWQEKRLIVGSEEPRLAAISAAWVVARHFRLPGWDL